MKILIVLFIISFAFSCSVPIISKLESSLRFAKSNRSELEKVIDYYSYDVKDSLKLKAAYFLIENMQYYYSIKSDKLELYKSEIYSLMLEHSWTTKEVYDFLEHKYGKLNTYDFEKIYDARVITSDYLISNIEQSFNTWQNQPWYKSVSFEKFCEEILPYRIGNEPLEDWRTNYYNYFHSIVDTMSDKKDPVKLYKSILTKALEKEWIFVQDLNLPHMGAKTLLGSRIGYCRDMCDFGTYIMRSFGIPGGIDFIIQQADDMYGEHSWNYVTDTLGNSIEVDMINEKENIVRIRKKARVYRRFFERQSESLKSYYDPTIVLTALYDPFMRDVSELYFPNNMFKIQICNQNIKGYIVYLGVFNNKKWIPVTGAKIQNNQVVFNNLDTTVMYMPLYYHKNEFIPFAGPFNINSNSFIFKPKPNFQVLQEMLLLRKHKYPHWWYRFGKRCMNGVFQGANKSDFSDAVDLYVINEPLTMNYYIIPINSNKKFQYVRYVSGINGYNNMAEIQFYGKKKLNLLTGEIIGTEGSIKNVPDRTKQAVFDNNPITFYDALEENGAWVGLKFDQPKYIEKIKFLFRNDDNNIRIGDEYELFYLDNCCKWKSLGRRVAYDVKLIYQNVPSGALYILRNHTRGKEERIFTYVNDQQIWW